MNVKKTTFSYFIVSVFLFSTLFSVVGAKNDNLLTRWDLFSINIYCKVNSLFNINNPKCDYTNIPKQISDIQIQIDNLPKENNTKIVYTATSGVQYIYMRGPKGDTGLQGPKGDTVYIGGNSATTTSWANIWNSTNSGEIRYQYVPVASGGGNGINGTNGTNGTNGKNGKDGNYITLITQNSTSTTYYIYDPNTNSTSTIVVASPYISSNSPVTIENGNSLFSTGLTEAGSSSLARNSIFLGEYAGSGAINADNSNFLGDGAGYEAINAYYSNFLGQGAGNEGINAGNSNFLGNSAGSRATNSSFSNFFGSNAGYGATNAANSIFIGRSAGQNDTVDNTINGLSSILIGSYTNTGGYSNSILLGSGTSGSPISNTKANQFMLAPSITELNLRGVNYTLPSTIGATGTVLTNDGSGVLSWGVGGGSFGGGTTTITSLITGVAPIYQGVILDEHFTGSSLDTNIWSAETTPTGVTVNNKLIVSSGQSDWSRYMEFKKHYLYEKEDIIFDFKPLTKNSGDAWGITQNSLLVLYNSSIYLKVDLSNGVNSGRLSIGNTTAANEYGYSQALDFNAGDNLRLTIKRTPWKTITILENLTDSSKPKAYGEFDLRQWGTQGNYRISFLGGQQEFTNIKIDSKVRNYGGTKGVVFFGDSITNGIGATSVSKRWTDVLMKGQQNLFENMGIGSWLTGTMNSSRVTELLTGINAKYLFINFGYNDFAQYTPTSTYRANLETIATTAQAMGYTTIFVSPFPNATYDSSSYASAMQTAAANTGSKYISIINATSIGGVANPNYLYDGVHPNDEGYRVIAEEIKKQIPEVYSDMVNNIDSGSIKSYDMPFAFGNESIVTVGSDGIFRQALAEQFITKNSLRLQSIAYETQDGSVSLSGDIIQGGSFQQKSNNGLRIGFNNGAYDNNGSNITITNAGTGGSGHPQLFNTINGTENIIINALAQVGKANAAGSVSGNRNLLLQTPIPNSYDLSGSRNILMSSTNFALNTGSDNILIGDQSGGLLTSGSYNIALTSRLNYNGGSSSWSANNAVGTIMIGTPYDYSGEEPLSNGEVVISSYTRFQRIYTFGTKGGLQTSVVWRPGYQGGINSAGAPLYIQGTRATGNAEPGNIVFQFSTPGSSGSAVQGTFSDTLTLSRNSIFANKNVGILQSNPSYALHVGSSSISDGATLLRLEDINSTCDFNANSGSPSCGSDITLKKDISSLDTSDILIKIGKLTPVSYHWKTQKDDDILNYGFIAQDVGAQFPDLVHEGTWVDGSKRLFLNTGGLMPYVVGAIKELNNKALFASVGSSTLVNNTLQTSLNDFSLFISTLNDNNLVSTNLTNLHDLFSSSSLSAIKSLTNTLTQSGFDLNLNGNALTNVKSIQSMSGNWRVGEDGKIIAKTIRVEGIELKDIDGNWYCYGSQNGNLVKIGIAPCSDSDLNNLQFSNNQSPSTPISTTEPTSTATTTNQDLGTSSPVEADPSSLDPNTTPVSDLE
jgi:lysophospholipase L1-like esterase